MDENVSIIESILDDHLDDNGPVFTFEIVKNALEEIVIFITNIKRRMSGKFTNDEIVQSLLFHYRNFSHLDPYPHNKNTTLQKINNTQSFQKIYRLTGYKPYHFRSNGLLSDQGSGTLRYELRLSSEGKNINESSNVNNF